MPTEKKISEKVPSGEAWTDVEKAEAKVKEPTPAEAFKAEAALRGVEHATPGDIQKLLTDLLRRVAVLESQR